MDNEKRKSLSSVVAEDLVPYCLRHTYCTDLEAAGVPINVHQSATVFESAATAINRYLGKEKNVGDTPSNTFKPEKNRKKQV